MKIIITLILLLLTASVCCGREREYKVKFYTGDYKDRQKEANEDGAICYIEQHFNSVEDNKVNYTLVLVKEDSPEISFQMGEYYTEKISKKFQIKKGNGKGLTIIKDGDRGYGNLKYAEMPSILLEPFFLSSPEGLKWAQERQDELAEILAETIYVYFPEGGLIAFSIGHKYKYSRPDDTGAGPFDGMNEIDFNEKVLEKAAKILDPDCSLPSETYFPGLYNEICNIIENNFYDKAFTEEKFPHIKENFEVKVKECNSKAEFNIIVRDMLKELNASHTSYYTLYDIEYYHLASIFKQVEGIKELFENEEILYPSAGIFTKEIDGKIFILSVMNGGAGEKSGLLKGDEIISVDGKNFAPMRSFLNKKEVIMKIKREEKGEILEVKLEPELISPAEELLRAERESAEIIEAEGKKIGYVHIWSFAGIEYYEELLDILQGDLQEAESLIFDLRDGWGGASPQYLNVFNKNVPVLNMIDREGNITEFDPQWKKPVVMLTNERVRSGKEILAWGFKKYNIGKVMGEKTAGATLGGRLFPLSDRSLLFLAIIDSRIGGEDLEGVGVKPDIKIPFDVRYCRGMDVQIKKARDYLLSL